MTRQACQLSYLLALAVFAAQHIRADGAECPCDCRGPPAVACPCICSCPAGEQAVSTVGVISKVSLQHTEPPSLCPHAVTHAIIADTPICRRETSQPARCALSILTATATARVWPAHNIAPPTTTQARPFASAGPGFHWSQTLRQAWQSRRCNALTSMSAKARIIATSRRRAPTMSASTSAVAMLGGAGMASSVRT